MNRKIILTCAVVGEGQYNKAAEVKNGKNFQEFSESAFLEVSYNFLSVCALRTIY